LNELLEKHPALGQDACPSHASHYANIANQALLRAIGMHEDNDSILGVGITSISSEELVRQCLDLRLAWMLLPDIQVSRERYIRLSDLILQTKPSDKIIRYLVLLNRCYLAELDASVVILCRAAL
jgi:hypothetical protein